MNILLIGSGAREHIIGRGIKKSKKTTNLHVLATTNNPGLKKLATKYQIADIKEAKNIAQYAVENSIDLAVVGPEAPLAVGVVDQLKKVGIKCFGPTKDHAQIETSKSFARQLLTGDPYNPCPQFQVFTEYKKAAAWLEEIDFPVVLKPDGLTGGKGVKVQGDHFHSKKECLKEVQNILQSDERLVIEEKLIGQEFSLMSICDGDHLWHMPAVQDHKRVGVGDTGPNTGGMGSYSLAGGSLPFLSAKDIESAQNINQQTAKALKNKFNSPYQGVLYGGFIATAQGVKLIEYNARWGDPEVMNILTVLQNDLVEVMTAATQGELDKIQPSFSALATVCKYVVPVGYPEKPAVNEPLDISRVDKKQVDIYFAAIDEQENGLFMTGSRALALVAANKDLYQAEKIVEEQIKNIQGKFHHRPDIGTPKLIEKRVQMMESLRKKS